tara:strand:+ start:86 stop:565 length:480 start_codon:yes stop_codon:yes gene_type:complete
MPEFEVKYHIREPVSRHPQSGAIKFQKDGSFHSPITVSAVDATDARKRAGRHPAILSAKERANKSIDSSVQAFGGKARHKVDEVKPKSKTKTAIKPKAAIKGGSGTGGTSKPGGVLSMRMPEPKLFDPNKGGRTSRSVRSRTMSLNKNKGGSVKKKAKK